jgi:transposase-like protein
MGKGIESLEQKEGLLGPDPLSEALRGKIREVIWTLAEAELSEVLAALPYERNGARCGYRNGKRERTIGTGLGQAVIELPRARVREGDGEKEWRSRLLERYQRRARSVDSALLGCYLSGTSSIGVMRRPRYFTRTAITKVLSS